MLVILHCCLGTYDFLYPPIDFKVNCLFVQEFVYYSRNLLFKLVRLITFFFPSNCRINAMWAMHLSICRHPLLLFHSTRFLWEFLLLIFLLNVSVILVSESFLQIRSRFLIFSLLKLI